MQATRVRALVWEDPTCCGATKPMRHNYWACALEPASHNYWAHVPQLLKPTCLEPVLRNKRSHRNEKPAHRNEDPTQPKINKYKTLKKKKKHKEHKAMCKRFGQTCGRLYFPEMAPQYISSPMLFPQHDADTLPIRSDVSVPSLFAWWLPQPLEYCGSGTLTTKVKSQQCRELPLCFLGMLTLEHSRPSSYMHGVATWRCSG